MPRPRELEIDAGTVLTTLIAIRLVNALTLRTFFQPDEYYQALEPAWDFTPDHHGAWVTWEWIQHLRSATHPALFRLVYQAAEVISKLSQVPHTKDSILLYAPKTAQAVVGALGDYYTWKLSQKVYDSYHLAFTTLCLSVLSPWQWFCSTRTFSNGFESTLTAAALCYWPFELGRDSIESKSGSAQKQAKPQTSSVNQQYRYVASLRVALLLAASATVIRPTNLLIWIILALRTIVSDRPPTDTTSQPKAANDTNDTITSRLKTLSREGILCGGIVLLASALVDRAFYGTWTLPALNFLYFNVVQSLAVFYGNNDWHYYLSQGYPLLLTTALPFTIAGLYRVFIGSTFSERHLPNTQKSLKTLAIICISLPAALSVLSHKEVRFIYPIIGPLLVITAEPASEFFKPLFVSTAKAPQFDARTKGIRASILALLLSLSLLIAGYTSLIHNSGLIALPQYFRNEFTTYYASPIVHSSPHSLSKDNHQPQPNSHRGQNMTVAILMPCHSLPWRSHLLHAPTQSQPGIQAWALTCEPPLHLDSPAAKKTYLDEADIFYANPQLWLRKNMSRRPAWTFSGQKRHDRRYEPGLHTDPNGRNKRLWSSVNDDDDPGSVAAAAAAQGLDITDLLPSLRTAPGKPPRAETDGAVVRRPWPHYFAFFEQLEPTMVRALRGTGYTECWRVFNSHWHDDWRRQGDVVVWCLFPERAMTEGNTGSEGFRAVDHNDHDDGYGEKVSEVKEGGRVVPERPGKQQVIRP